MQAVPAKRILVTRPEPGASQTAERLVALGFSPVLAPVLAITSTGTNFRPPHRLAATLVTSRNAVPACPPACRERLLFAVGSATATCAAEAGFTQVIDADGDAMALAAVVESRLSPKDGSLFFPTARGQGFPLVNCLRQRGYSVIRRVAYEATPVPVLPQE